MRPEGSPILEVASAETYISVMVAAGVTLPVDQRREDVAAAVGAATVSAGGESRADPALEAEVANLIEQPHAILGSFDPAFLDLPAEVLGTVMKKHQRYFPVYGPSGDLLPSFVVVLNGAHLDPDLARHGHEAVIAARFADAAYFWRKDLGRPLAAYTADLERLMFERRLGTMLDKVHRLEALAPALASELGLAEADATVVRSAAALCKSDLATSLVVEMTSLQGVAGRHYALRSGEPAEVADAILEHYLPRGAGDSLPVSSAGRVLGLADRLDTLCGLFAVGQRPTGTQDPFGLRRAALGISTLVVDGDLDLDLGRAVELTASHLPVPVTPEVGAEILGFLARRLEGQLREDGNPADAVSAALAVLAPWPARAARAAAVLAARAAEPGWETTLTAYARCARIVRSAGGGTAAARQGGAAAVPGVGESRRDATVEPAERVLVDALTAIESEYDPDDLRSVIASLDHLAPLVHAFFDTVLVMAEDPAVRAGRLELVGRIADLPRQVADLSLMEGF
jgi:glycyl-tRNA synthetase